MTRSAARHYPRPWTLQRALRGPSSPPISTVDAAGASQQRGTRRRDACRAWETHQSLSSAHPAPTRSPGHLQPKIHRPLPPLCKPCRAAARCAASFRESLPRRSCLRALGEAARRAATCTTLAPRRTVAHRVMPRMPLASNFASLPPRSCPSRRDDISPFAPPSLRVTSRRSRHALAPPGCDSALPPAMLLLPPMSPYASTRPAAGASPAPDPFFPTVHVRTSALSSFLSFRHRRCDHAVCSGVDSRRLRVRHGGHGTRGAEASASGQTRRGRGPDGRAMGKPATGRDMRAGRRD